MSAHDIYYGKVTLPDGRVCEATVRGINHPDTWFEPGYFEPDEDAPLEIDNIDGKDPDIGEYECVYVVGAGDVDAQTVTLSEYVIEHLLEHGTFEAWQPDEDDYL